MAVIFRRNEKCLIFPLFHSHQPPFARWGEGSVRWRSDDDIACGSDMSGLQIPLQWIVIACGEYPCPVDIKFYLTDRIRIGRRVCYRCQNAFPAWPFTCAAVVSGVTQFSFGILNVFKFHKTRVWQKRTELNIVNGDNRKVIKKIELECAKILNSVFYHDIKLVWLLTRINQIRVNFQFQGIHRQA